MEKYDLYVMSFDGETKKEKSFKSIIEAWEYEGNLGSKWYFYPFRFIVKNKIIKEMGGNLAFLNNKRISTVKKLFKTISMLPEAENLDVYEFELLILSYQK